MVAETSLLAYADILGSLGKRQMLVLKAIDKIEPCNNTMIANYLKLPINCVVPRVYELRKLKMIKLIKTDICPYTSKMSMFWGRIRR